MKIVIRGPNPGPYRIGNGLRWDNWGNGDQENSTNLYAEDSFYLTGIDILALALSQLRKFSLHFY